MNDLIDMLVGRDGTHPKDVSHAFNELRQRLARQEGQAEDKQWRSLFDEAKLQGMSPSQLVQDGKYAPSVPGMSNLERWKNQVDGLITSNNPVLQQKGLQDLTNYQQRATETPTDPRASSVKEFMFAKQNGFEGSYTDFLELKRASTTIDMGGADRVNVQEAKGLRYLDPNNQLDENGREIPIVGRPWNDILGQVETITDAEMNLENSDKLIGLLDNQLFGEKGIYNDDIFNQNLLSTSVQSTMKTLLQSDPRYKTYQDMLEGTIATFVKSLGDKGALSEKDITRGVKLFPSISSKAGRILVDSKAVAQLKMKYMKMLFAAGGSKTSYNQIIEIAESDIKELKETEKESINTALPPGAVELIEE